ncbi:MAG TPA: transposase [Pyrinomonadaceae bacterium]|jgi:transposase
MDIRQQKGLAIANKATIKKDGNLYLVPSQSGRGKYKVDADAKHCTCPDFDFRQAKCKHIYAVEHTIEQTEKTKTTVTANGKTTTTETVKVTRQTYRQEWPAYNKAQMNEKRLFLYLLHQLCQGVGSPAQHGAGQRRMSLEDMIFAMAFKVYSTVSGRRFMTDLRDAQGKGYLSQAPSYNVIFDYFQSEMLTPYLQMLIEESSLPLAAIEKDFAVDSSGLSTCRFVQWISAKYTDSQLLEAKDWIKVHLMCGVKTNVVTAVEITDRYAGDSPHFKPLVEATAKNFYMMQEVSADKAYLSSANLKVVQDAHAMPYIAFRANSNASGRRQSELWKRMYHYYSHNQEWFMQHYHKRSNVETTFHMIKSKFGDALRSKTKRAQINEALCKILCHNICCLIQSMYELNLKPKFWSVAA